EETLRSRCAAACDIVSYDGNTDAMREVETGKIDATLQDTPIAAFYGPRFPGLVPIGEPVSPGYYVIYVPKGDDALLHAINVALATLWQSGEIERIDRRYGIWDARQSEIGAIVEKARFFGYDFDAAKREAAATTTPDDVVTARPRKRGWEVVRDYAGVLLQSAGLTVLLSCLSFPLAIALGLVVALGRLYGPRWLRPPLAAYVEFVRGTPVMLQLYFVFFFLPEIGITVPALWTGVLGLAVN